MSDPWPYKATTKSLWVLWIWNYIQTLTLGVSESEVTGRAGFVPKCCPSGITWTQMNNCFLLCSTDHTVWEPDWGLWGAEERTGTLKAQQTTWTQGRAGVRRRVCSLMKWHRLLQNQPGTSAYLLWTAQGEELAYTAVWDCNHCWGGSCSFYFLHTLLNHS